MDTVYVSTKSLPQNLSEKEMVLSSPSFVEEVKASYRKKGSSPTLQPNYLRAIAAEIGSRYDRMFNPYRNVVPQDYMGIICNSDEETANVVHAMFQARYPEIYSKYYEHMIKSRKMGIRVIYFTGLPEHEEVFKRLGIEKIEESQISDYLGTTNAKQKQPVKKVETIKEPIKETKLEEPAIEVPKEEVVAKPTIEEAAKEEAVNVEKVENVVKKEVEPIKNTNNNNHIRPSASKNKNKLSRRK